MMCRLRFLQPPIVPHCSHEGDTRNFDAYPEIDLKSLPIASDADLDLFDDFWRHYMSARRFTGAFAHVIILDRALPAVDLSPAMRSVTAHEIVTGHYFLGFFRQFFFTIRIRIDLNTGLGRGPIEGTCVMLINFTVFVYIWSEISWFDIRFARRILF